jgi:2-oxo-4-hydroxy-4-carboxy-5-ureidoimidazoline decarboxylase
MQHCVFYVSCEVCYVTIDELNALEQAAFTATLANIFEHSPWVAEGAYPARPFTDIDGLYQAMVTVMYDAEENAQLALIRAHPDLAGKAARTGDVTDASKSEQAGAGLDQLDNAEFARFHALNERYRDAFGFPFILAVKGHNKHSILAAFEQRLEHTPEQEKNTALTEIAKIARFRLDALFS